MIKYKTPIPAKARDLKEQAETKYTKALNPREVNQEFMRSRGENFRQYAHRLGQIQKFQSADTDPRKDPQNYRLKNLDFRRYNINTKMFDDINIFNQNLCETLAEFKQGNYLEVIKTGIKVKSEINLMKVSTKLDQYAKNTNLVK